MKVEDEFKSVVNSIKAECYCIASSGGVDSMVLLFLAQKFKLPLRVLHVNYNLRDEESTEDALFLKDYCSKNKIPISTLEIYLKEQLKEQGGNLQNEARKIRYDFFQSELKKVEHSKLLVAHHKDDQIETFWLQLYRGSGLKGMGGMTKESGEIIRPFLNIGKQELSDYALSNGINWREDKSNSYLDYQRNLWRNKYIPFLTSVIPSINDSVLILQSIFQENLIEIRSKIFEVKNKINKHNYIDINELLNFEITEIIELFRSLSIPVNQVEAALKLFDSQKGCKIKWKYSNGNFHEIIREEKGFSFTRIEQQFNIPNLIVKPVKSLPLIFDKSTFYFNLKKIKGELIIRPWKKGDRIFPIGMKGSKLISDIITDAKIPNSKRRNQLVICDEEKILACIGLCIDRRAIATNSSFILRVSLQNQSAQDIDLQ
jgi:tRNA(Ile)-lysidine synthase